jgi:Gas vesicle protein K
MRDKVLHRPPDLELFADERPRFEDALTRRIGADPENLQKGLAQLVLTVVELLRQLMERQALRRIDAGDLAPEQEERLGETFMELSRRMDELKAEFGLDDEDLNLNLGPLGNLL